MTDISNEIQQQVEQAIATYKIDKGFYPPDNKVGNNSVRPYPNSLYYELTGAEFDRGTSEYRIGGETISRSDYMSLFGNGNVAGIYNSSVSKRNVEDFLSGSQGSASHHVRVSPDTPDLDVLAVPVVVPLGGGGLCAAGRLFRAGVFVRLRCAPSMLTALD